MYDDSMSSSHPIYKQVNSAAEIDELFDSIETTKAEAIFRMADSYIEQIDGSKNQTLQNIIVIEKNKQIFNSKTRIYLIYRHLQISIISDILFLMNFLINIKFIIGKVLTFSIDGCINRIFQLYPLVSYPQRYFNSNRNDFFVHISTISIYIHLKPIHLDTHGTFP